MSDAEQYLRAAIAESPDDPEPRLVYADWLEEHGDPRAELVRAVAHQNMVAALRSIGATKRLWQTVEPSQSDLSDLLHQHELTTLPWPRFAADCAERACLSQQDDWTTDELRRAIELARSDARDPAAAEGFGSFPEALTSHVPQQSLAIYVMLSQFPDPTFLRFEQGRDYAILAADLALELVARARSRYRIPRPGSPEEIEQLLSREVPTWFNINPAAIEAEIKWQVLRACEYQAFGHPLTPVVKPRKLDSA